jgi:hypothetical protein
VWVSRRRNVIQPSSIVLAARDAPEGCSPVIPGGGVDPPPSRGQAPAKSEGTARRDARPVRLCTPPCGSVAPLGAPSRLSPRDLAPRSSAPGRASWDVALAAASRLRPVPAQRAPRRPVVVPDGRSPGAARERGERSHARERRALTRAATFTNGRQKKYLPKMIFTQKSGGVFPILKSSVSSSVS